MYVQQKNSLAFMSKIKRNVEMCILILSLLCAIGNNEMKTAKHFAVRKLNRPHDRPLCLRMNKPN